MSAVKQVGGWRATQVLKLLKQIQLEERGEVEPPPIALPTAEDFDEDFDEDESEEDDEDEDEDDDDDEDDSDDGRALPSAQRAWAWCAAHLFLHPMHWDAPVLHVAEFFITSSVFHCIDGEVEGFFDDDDDDAPSPSRRKSGLSMAAIQQRDSSFFGFEDPGNAFVDDDDVAWQDEGELQSGNSAAAADADGGLEDLPADDSPDAEDSKDRAGSVTSSRRRWRTGSDAVAGLLFIYWISWGFQIRQSRFDSQAEAPLHGIVLA
jgi:hypothetical protein